MHVLVPSTAEKRFYMHSIIHASILSVNQIINVLRLGDAHALMCMAICRFNFCDLCKTETVNMKNMRVHFQKV